MEDTVGYNSAYISINLLDELDYYLGGYGKPNIEFLFSLNTFVETFIGSSSFYTSLDELNHLNLITPALFPNGRPILNMLVKTAGLKFVNGILDKPGTEIYRGMGYNQSKKEAQREFILDYGLQARKYLIKSDIEVEINEIPLVNSKFIDDEFIVSEVMTSSPELVSNLLNVSRTTSVQTTLPMYLYEKQISTMVQTPASITALENLAKIHESNVEELVKNMNYSYLPIPPFTNILLDQVSSIGQIPRQLLQLRHDFQELRDNFIALEKEIAESETIRKQNEAYKKFRSYWAAFNRKYDNKRHRIFFGMLDFSQGVNIDKAVDRYIDDRNPFDALKELNLGKLGANIIGSAYTKLKDRKIINRFKGLTNIWELFQSGSGVEQQVRHFERLFGVKFGNVEINKVQRFIKNKLHNLTDDISS